MSARLWLILLLLLPGLAPMWSSARVDRAPAGCAMSTSETSGCCCGPVGCPCVVESNDLPAEAPTPEAPAPRSADRDSLAATPAIIAFPTRSTIILLARDHALIPASFRQVHLPQRSLHLLHGVLTT